MSKKKHLSQSAVIPFIKRKDDFLIVLISSRRNKNWIFPKGKVEPELSKQASAAKEAMEEAGIQGIVYDKKIGEFSYKKDDLSCDVKVYPMLVSMVHETWEEDSFRERTIVPLPLALEMIENKKMRKIVKKLPEYIRDCDDF